MNSSNHSNSIRKVIAMELPLVGIMVHIMLYAALWFTTYYPLVRLRLKFYRNGHILVFAIYLILLMFFMATYGGMNVGYVKVIDAVLSQSFALIIVNVISYFQDSLLRNWLLPAGWMVLLTAAQILVSVIWVNICDRVYKRTFPPIDLVLIHGERSTTDILRKFDSRKDKYNVVRQISIDDGMESIEQAIRKENKGVILWDLPVDKRDHLIKYCYEHTIRIYMMPKIPDVLIKGSVQLHVFDSPVYMTREYALSFRQRFWKRAIDVTCSLILIVLTSPFFLLTALAVKLYDGGPVFYKQTRCTLHMQEFKIIKFRSMRVDAERDGVARLAAEHDDRITPVGHVIRKCRFDELPQLWNILVGEMSFIGPRPERPEIIAQYVKEMPEFVYRTRVKAGLAGYAQIYGKYNTTPYDKLKLDLTYIHNYSLWLDIKLMLLTLKILLTPDSTEGVSEGQVTAMHTEEEHKA